MDYNSGGSLRVGTVTPEALASFDSMEIRAVEKESAFPSPLINSQHCLTPGSAIFSTIMRLKKCIIC